MIITTSDYEYNKYVQEKEQREKIRKDKVNKIPINKRDCSDCRWSKIEMIDNCDRTIQCTHSGMYGEVENTKKVCEFYDPLLWHFYKNNQ